MNEQFFNNLIAGRVPAVKGRVDAAVQHVASAALQTSKVHVVISNHDGYAYYLAAASSMFTQVKDYYAPLAISLPGHADHRGPGIYVEHDHGTSTAIIVAEDRFEKVSGAAESIANLIEAEGLPVFEVAGSVGSLMTSPMGRSITDGHKFGLLIAKVGVAWLAAAGVTLVGLHGATFFLKTVTQEDLNKAYFEATAQITIAQPLSDDLAAMEKVSNVAIRSGGWIEKYKREKGVESFIVSLPQWVSKDHVEALGPNVVTELDRKSEQIIATKIAKEALRPITPINPVQQPGGK